MHLIFKITLLLTSFSLLAETGVEVDKVLKALKSEHAESYAKSLLIEDDWIKYDKILSGIKKGSIKWLEVGKLIKQYTDAGASMALSITMAQAIKNNPELVLV